MKKINWKQLLAFILSIVTIYFISSRSTYFFDQLSFTIFAALSYGFFLFNLYVRKNARFRPYFMSKYNMLTSKIRIQQEFDFSKDILFDKLLEVLPESGFKIIQKDKTTGDIFAISRVSWFSWGENIYIKLNEDNGSTHVDFCSACFFQVYSWGKNERNFTRLMADFEKSLTI